MALARVLAQAAIPLALGVVSDAVGESAAPTALFVPDSRYPWLFLHRPAPAVALGI
eukprot:gene10796-9461_t